MVVGCHIHPPNPPTHNGRGVLTAISKSNREGGFFISRKKNAPLPTGNPIVQPRDNGPSWARGHSSACGKSVAQQHHKACDDPSKKRPPNGLLITIHCICVPPTRFACPGIHSLQMGHFDAGRSRPRVPPCARCKSSTISRFASCGWPTKNRGFCVAWADGKGGGIPL